MSEKRQPRLESTIALMVRRGFLYTLGIAILAVVLLVWPDQAVTVAYFAAAGIVILIGLWRVIRYFREDPKEAREQQLLSGGALRVFLGVLMLLYNVDVRNSWLQAICGAALLVVGSIRLQAAFDMKRRSVETWMVPLSVAALSLILGIAALLIPQSRAVLMLGIALCVEALTDLYCRFKFAAMDREARKTAQAVPPEPSEAPAEPPQTEKTE